MTPMCHRRADALTDDGEMARCRWHSVARAGSQYFLMGEEGAAYPPPGFSATAPACVSGVVGKDRHLPR